MNLQFLNPMRYFGDKATNSSGTVVRKGNALGPYNSAFDNYVFREFNPHLYEAIREAMAPIDGAINKMVMLDGVVEVEAETDALQNELDDWMEGVKVNDVEQGFQAFYRSQGNEMYEQGCTIGDYFINAKEKDVTNLRVGDSKGIHFQRNKQTGELDYYYAPPAQKRGKFDGTENIERVLRNSYEHNGNITSFLEGNNYHKLDPSTLIYAGFNNEADNPYGVSLMRSTEYDSRILLIMKNALGRTWERFGDPIFNVTLKKKKGRGVSQKELDEQEKKIAKNLSDAMTVKKSGNSADIVNIIGPDDEFNIEVLGGDGQVLEIEMPARHLLENIVAKTGLPSWMLGFHWSTAERLALKQSEIVLQDSSTRFSLRKPQLIKPIHAMLRARGIAFNLRDIQLVQNLPNLQDLEAKSRSNLMDAQAEAIRNGADINPNQQSNANNEDDDVKKFLSVYSIANNNEDARLLEMGGCLLKAHNHKAESYVEDEPALMRLERKVERALLSAWDQLYDDVIVLLNRGFNKSSAKSGLKAGAKADHAPVFVFDVAIMLTALKTMQEEFINAMGGEGSVLHTSTLEAFERGIQNALSEDVLSGLDYVTETTRARISRQLQQNGLKLVRDGVIREFGDDIISALAQGAYDGLNPKEVASELKKRFDASDYNWKRLARSEIGMAQGDGKIEQYKAQSIAWYDWVPAAGACPICLALAAGGPYRVGHPDSPRIVKNSHPQDRCTLAAHITV